MLRFRVTAGGTREPIDDARVIANTSTGRLGSRIARAAAAAGHDVTLLLARSATAPDAGLRCLGFETSGELWQLMAEHAPRADVVLHAAAVSDYVPERTEGKLGSDEPEIVLRLRRAPKLIDRLRPLCPASKLVGFKLTSGKDRDGQVAAARELLERAQLDLVVCNDASRIGEEDHEVLLVDRNGAAPGARGKQAIAEGLIARLTDGLPREAAAS